MEFDFVCSFDYKKIDQFNMLYHSIKNLYADNFSIVAFVDFDLSLVERSNYKNVKFIICKDNDFIPFKITSSLKHINSMMAYGKMMVYYYYGDFIKSKSIYLDTDILLSNKINLNYFESEDDNYAFNLLKNCNSLTISDYSNYRRSLHEGNNLQGNLLLNKMSNLVLDKIDNREYFNSGVMIINSKSKFNFLIEKVISKNLISQSFSDQDLLNMYNISEFTIINDQNMNLVLDINHNFNKSISIVHFSGEKNIKRLMEIVYSKNFNFEILYDKTQFNDIKNSLNNVKEDC